MKNSTFYGFCLICSSELNSLTCIFESYGSDRRKTRNQNVVGILCQLLNLPLTDNTLNFGEKFQQTRFCAVCTRKIKGFEKFMKDLKELEIKIMEGRNEIEHLLKKSCEIQNGRRNSQVEADIELRSNFSVVNGSSRRIGSSENDEDEDTVNNKIKMHPVEHFREEIVTELNKTKGTSTIPKIIPESGSANFCKKCISGQEQKSETQESLNFGSSLKIDSPNSGILSHGNEADLPQHSHPKMAEGTPSPSGELEFAVRNGDLNVLESPSSINSDELEDVDEEDDDADEIYTERMILRKETIPKGETVIVNGEFNCPFAPKCTLTFKKNERIKFLAHTRLVHQTKIHKVVPEGEIEIPKIKIENGGKVNSKSKPPKIVKKKEIIRCETCGTRFNNKSLLSRHVTKYHRMDLILTSPKSKKSYTNSDFKCDVCDEHFKTTRTLATHKNTHIMNMLVSVKSEVVDEDVAFRESESDMDSDCYNCHLCGVKFLFKGDLTRHLMISHDNSDINHADNANFNFKSESSSSKLTGDYMFTWTRF